MAVIYILNAVVLLKLICLDYPSYELFTDRLRAGVFHEGKGRQLRLVVGKDRKTREVLTY